MNILLTNDDGYTSKGLHCLAAHLKKKHKVFIVAPENEMSGSAHSVSFFSGLSYREVDGERGVISYAVNGTPADCVLFGLTKILKDEKIDLVVSGVNTVLNIGSDYLYSGTVGAAQEATYLGYKAVALSLDTKQTDDYDDTCRFFADNVEVFTKYIVENVTLNINFPYTDIKKSKGIKIAPCGHHPYSDDYISQTAKDGSEIFFVTGRPFPQKDSGLDNDCTHIENGYITVTPLKLLASCEDTIDNLKTAVFKI